ncbi:MAG: hypothetical protein KAT43_06055 [Nanoarchaeota archaeon]|nr:hypothetical protein [Nanoarchaeota archaeon]
MEGYCVKCKTKREMQKTKEVILKNKRRAMKGECPKCGTKMCRILGKADAKAGAKGAAKKAA